MENKKTALLMTFAVLASAACTNKSEITEKDLTGNWIEVMPVKCPFFSLDRNLATALVKEFHDLKFVEKDFTII